MWPWKMYGQGFHWAACSPFITGAERLLRCYRLLQDCMAAWKNRIISYRAIPGTSQNFMRMHRGFFIIDSCLWQEKAKKSRSYKKNYRSKWPEEKEQGGDNEKTCKYTAYLENRADRRCWQNRTGACVGLPLHHCCNTGYIRSYICDPEPSMCSGPCGG